MTALTIGGGTLLGDLVMLWAALVWALYSIISVPVARRLGALRVTAHSLLLGSLCLVPFGAWQYPDMSWQEMTSDLWAAFGFTSVVAGALAVTWWYAGLSRMGPTRALVFTYLMPVFALVTAMMLLAERMTLVQLSGAAIILVGIWLTRAE